VESAEPDNRLAAIDRGGERGHEKRCEVRLGASERGESASVGELDVGEAFLLEIALRDHLRRVTRT
jgi:hypothetical protein